MPATGLLYLYLLLKVTLIYLRASFLTLLIYMNIAEKSRERF